MIGKTYFYMGVDWWALDNFLIDDQYGKQVGVVVAMSFPMIVIEEEQYNILQYDDPNHLDELLTDLERFIDDMGDLGYSLEDISEVVDAAEQLSLKINGVI